MNIKNKSKNSINFLNLTLSFLMITLLFCTKVQAAKTLDGEELSYEELLRELNQQKSEVYDDSISSFDSTKIHAGIGYVNSFSNLTVNDEHLERYQNAIQLSLGIDLFSRHWYSEGAFRNYGLTEKATESIYLKQIDLKIGYKDNIQGPWNFLISTGLSTRYLDYSDSAKNINISNTTPSLMGTLGLSAQLNPQLQFNIETTARGALIKSTSDRSSMDFMLKLETSL